jgi:hypothetical protein
VSGTHAPGITDQRTRLRTCSKKNLVRAWRDAEAELGVLAGVAPAALRGSFDGTRVMNYGQLRSVEDWKNLRKIG